MAKIGFIGLGHMGQPMATHLLKAGHDLMVYDLAPKAVATMAALGAKTATTLADMSAHADTIITMLPMGEHVEEVCLAVDGLFSTAVPGTLFIDSSSIAVETARELHTEATARGFVMVDAPVSGGVAGAEAATLTFMVGGTPEAFTRAQPILAHMGKTIVHAGAAGHGQAAKICNNMMLGIAMIAVCEGFTLGQKLGLSAEKLFEISAHASAQCWSMTSYCPVPGLVPTAPANHNYAPGFTAQMMLKDLRLSQQAAQHVGAATPLGAEATALYTLFTNLGEGQTDFSGIIKMIEGHLHEQKKS